MHGCRARPFVRLQGWKWKGAMWREETRDLLVPMGSVMNRIIFSD